MPLTPTLSPKGRGRDEQIIFMLCGASKGHEYLFGIQELVLRISKSCIVNPASCILKFYPAYGWKSNGFRKI